MCQWANHKALNNYKLPIAQGWQMRPLLVIRFSDHTFFLVLLEDEVITEISFYTSLIWITVVSVCSYLLFCFLPNIFSWFEKLLVNI